MTFDDFYNLTRGHRAGMRSAGDWSLAQMTAISDYAVHNPWMRHQLGTDIKVQVQAAKDGSLLMFVFSRADGVSGS